MIKAVIIEDEKDGQLFLQQLLARLCPEVEVLGMADSVESGYRLIRMEQPQLVFLDIHMPGGSGFDLLKRFPGVDFKVIFITAHDEFALQAIKSNALDYLLKPIDPTELVAAVAKVRAAGTSIEQMKKLMDSLQTSPGLTRIAIPSESMVKYVEITSIIHCRAEGNYTWCYLEDGSRIISTKLLREYEEILAGQRFFRIHRSHLINMKRVREFRRQQELVIMEDGTELEVSRKKRTGFLRAMEMI